MTPVLASISPRLGSVLGGDEVVITLEAPVSTQGVRRLNTDPLAGSVLIDGRECTITTTTATEIRCITSDKPFVEGDEPRLDIYINGQGLVATKG